jgi:PAS domain S-box-containing protein/putative nucleotidyltransferase with HDIG domain
MKVRGGGMAKGTASAQVRGLMDIRQGTHLCQFYKTRKELLDVLVPFFKAGIESQEFCLWITSDPLGRIAARRAMKDAVPDFDALVARGQVKLLEHGDWYSRNGTFDAKKSARAFITEINQAMDSGYLGVRLATNLGWLEKKDWGRFTDFEEGADGFVSGRPMRVICSYPLEKCGAVEVLDIVRSHHSVIVKDAGEWRLVKTSGQQTIRRLLKDTEREYEHLFANVLDGLLVFDVETMKVVLANQAAAAISGFGSPEELEMVDVTRHISDGDRTRLLSLLAFARREEQSPVVEDARIVTRDGREVWVDVVCKKIDYQGRPAALIALREVTDRKRAEEELLASQEKNRVLIENANEAIVVIQDELLKFANPRTEELFGCAAEDLVSRPVREVIHPDDRHTVMEQHFRRLRGDGVPNVHEFRIVDKTGRTKWVELNGVMLAWEDRPADLCFLRDITQRKLADERLQESYQKLQDTLDGVIQAMALTVETRDRHTAGHQRRVTELAYAIATEIGLSKERSRAVSIAGMLHDLGKITIPTEILSKPGRLTEMEFAIVKTHPKAGYDILKNIEFPWPVAEIVVQHHERLDGSGYPSGLKGDQSALEARILAVADVVEAMASHRPYRPALGVDRALNEISGNKGRLYDSDVVEACLTVFNSRAFRFADQGI